MSLYGKSNSNQGSAIGNLVPASGLPMWMLALAAYFAAMTLTNKIPSLILWLENDLLKAEYIGYFLGAITGVLSVIVLGLFLFRRNVFYLYYLMLAVLTDMARTIASAAGKVEDLNSYFYSLQGLDFVPYWIFSRLIGWNNVSDPIKHVVGVVNPVVSVAFCALLLYFHSKRQPKTRPL